MRVAPVTLRKPLAHGNSSRSSADWHQTPVKQAIPVVPHYALSLRTNQLCDYTMVAGPSECASDVEFHGTPHGVRSVVEDRSDQPISDNDIEQVMNRRIQCRLLDAKAAIAPMVPHVAE